MCTWKRGTASTYIIVEADVNHLKNKKIMVDHPPSSVYEVLVSKEEEIT